MFKPTSLRKAMLATALGLLGLFHSVGAADFCVGNATDLQAALNGAATNSQADRVLVVRGTYTGPFVYTSSERYALQVLGGYTAGCGSRTLDATNTILEGDGADRVLTLTTSNGGALTVEGVTISGGVKTGDGGGLYVSTISNITLRDNIIQDNSATVKGGGAYITSESTMYVERNTFSNNGGDNSTDEGGGLYVFTDHGTLAMIKNSFDNNRAYYKGAGAILNTNLGIITLTKNTFKSCKTSFYYHTGAGVFVQISNAGSVALVNNEFTSNTATNSAGGGAYITAPVASGVALSNNLFQSNTAAGLGGGLDIASTNTPVTVVNNRFIGNKAGQSGGGAYILGSVGTIVMTSNIFEINQAGAGGNSGGGAYIATKTGPATLSGNVFYTNNAGHGGGAAIQTDGIATLTNNTFENNAGSVDAGGLWFRATSETETSSLYNNLYWNNHAPTGGDLWIDNDSDNDTVISPLDLMHNNFDQTANTGYWTKVAITIDPSNLDLDPLFDDTDTQHLSADSPMIDEGDSDAPGLPSTDIDGEDRIMGSAVDIGADEYDRGTLAFTLTVNKDGTGRGTLTSTPAGIRCGTTCNADFAAGTRITLTARPSSGSTFGGWTGCTPKPKNPKQCTLTLTADAGVKANFRVMPTQSDLVITGIRLTPTDPTPNSRFNATVTVKNQGGLAGDGGYLDLWTNMADTQTCGAQGNAWAAVGTLAAGASKTLTITNLRSGRAGNKTLRAFVDSWCETDESDENNNQRAKVYTVK